MVLNCSRVNTNVDQEKVQGIDQHCLQSTSKNVVKLIICYIT